MQAFALAAARLLSRVAAAFLLAMMALNVVDVGLRTTINAPIFGTYEVVELLLAAVAFLAIPEVFLRDGHITIELIDQLVPARGLAWLKAAGTLAALIFVGLLAYHMIQPAIEFVAFNDVTVDLQIPLIWKGSLVLAAFACAVAAVVVVFIRDIARAAGRAR